MYIKIKLNRTILCFCGILIAIICFSVLYSGFTPEAQPVSTQQEGIQLPIVMYHSILKDTKLQGQYVIGPDQFESDLKMLKEKGYTTITVTDLVDYVYNDKELPEKPIMLTFDDGYYNNYLYAYPLLEEYECKAVLSPIGYYSEQYSQDSNPPSPSYSHCTWSQLKEIQDSGYVEIQNHSYNMHSQSGRLGVSKKQGESNESYNSILVEDISTAQNLFKDNLNYTPIAFTYPFGAVSDTSEDVIKSLSFKCSLICEEKINTITKDKESLYMLGRFLRPTKMTSAELFEKLES
ncbi:MAG: polysaccharide deacetylase family protein [Acutalibacteraceae bacterium]|nr:polysaccharide deacetylase family protein [Acutalibacteraceae bacterium]